MAENAVGDFAIDPQPKPSRAREPSALIERKHCDHADDQADEDEKSHCDAAWDWGRTMRRARAKGSRNSATEKLRCAFAHRRAGHRPRHRRQLCSLQVAQSPRMAGRPSRLDVPFHAHLSFLAQRGRRILPAITRRRIRRGAFASIADLEIAIARYIDVHIRCCRPFVWTTWAEAVFE